KQGSPPFDQDENEEPAGDPSPLLLLTSAWSVWPEFKNIPALKTLAEHVELSAEPIYPACGWAVIGTNGVIYANPLRAAPAAEWRFVLAHLLAHLGLRHQPDAKLNRLAAYELTASALIMQLGIGTPPDEFLMPTTDWRTDAEAVFADWQRGD